MFKALIFDIVASKTIEDRENFQYLLINIINDCNKLYKASIASAFQITSGDEWEGLLFYSSKEDDIINYFYNSLPTKINFYVGFGIGDLTIKNLKLPVNQLDGSVFHNARSNLILAKTKGIIYTPK